MGAQRSAAVMAALCGTFVLAGWGTAGLVSLALPGIENPAAPIVAMPKASRMAEAGRAATDRVVAAFSDLAKLPPAAPAVQTASAPTPDPVPDEVATPPAAETTAVASLDSVPDLPTPPVDAPRVPGAPAHTPDPASSDVAAMLPAEIAEAASLEAIADLPAPVPAVKAAALSAPAHTTDPAPSEVAAMPAPENPEPANLEAIADLPTPAPAVETAALTTPARDEVAAATPDAAAAETVSIAAWPRTLPRPGVQLASLGTADPVPGDSRQTAVLETLDECLVPEICIDQYLWAHYQRTPKVDTNKVVTRIKATVKHKGKTRTVTKTFTRYVVADFTWKDPAAAEKVGMSLKDYVIGGMDRGFKLKLYRALRAMNDAGLMPGITSAFRDDYRQAIASGNKAASDSSYHGGSRRGGYGYGMAADLVSVKGATRLERFASSRELWSWVDAREKELAIGRPYLDRDPPHVGPIDGKEFSAKRGVARAKLAAMVTKRRQVAARDDHGATKHTAR
jgi:hypothetical protein